MTPAPAIAAGDAFGTSRAPSLGAVLRSHLAWRRYVASLVRLRRATPYRDRLPPSLRARLLDDPVMLEGRIMRATGHAFGTVLAAGQADAEAVARRYRRWLP